MVIFVLTSAGSRLKTFKIMANTYSFTIDNNETNCNWVINNLDDRDYQVSDDGIVITYYNIMQKNDILKAIADA